MTITDSPDVHIEVTPTGTGIPHTIQEALDRLATVIHDAGYPDWRIDIAVGPTLTITAEPAPDLADDDRE